jgi:ATP-dependent RNA helicase RhlB
LKFSELNLSAQLNEAIEKLNYKDCTPIQEQAIPHILEGKDVAGLAQTGTGKTAAFLLPLIERVLRGSELRTISAAGVRPTETVEYQRETNAVVPDARTTSVEVTTTHQEAEVTSSDASATNMELGNTNLGARSSSLEVGPSNEVKINEKELIQKRAFIDWKPFQFILVLVPTRELAEQVYENFISLTVNTGLKACSIYGGTSYDKQKEGLKNGVTLVVATPGRLIDLYKEHLVDLKQVRAVVFDEADRMFDMGFKDDMKYLLQRIPNDRQFLVFSATLNFDVLNTAYQFGANPVEVNISRDQAKAENVEDSIFHLGSDDKPKYLLSLLKLHQPKQCVIFSNFKNQIDPLVRFLRNNKIPALGISSLLTQAQRNKVLQQFKEENETQVLVATDVAARGLDIQGIDMVINYELPQDCETYVHRIGRTGRAGLLGKAFSFVGDRDVDSLMRIEEYLKHKINVSWLEDQSIISDFEPLSDGARRHDGPKRHDGPRRHDGPGRDRGDRKFSGERPRRERPSISRDQNKPAEGVDHQKNVEARSEAQQNGRSGKYVRGGNDSHHKKDHRDHSKKRDGQQKTEPLNKRDFSQKRDHTQKRYNKPHSTSGNHHKPKSHLPARPGVYKINLWYRIVKFFKNIFQ